MEKVGSMCYITLNVMLGKASHSFRFHCNNETCEIDHYNSLTEGSFVFMHLPLTVEVLIISESSGQLNLSSVQHLHGLQSIELYNSDVKTVSMPTCYALSIVAIINVPLHSMSLSVNNALRKIIFKNTALTAIPYSVRQQSHLIDLHLTNSRLRTFRFDSLVNLTDLCGLDLSQNHLSTLIPDHTGRCCPQLKEVSLNRNRLVYFNFGLLATMKQLVSVLLLQNSLRSLSNEYPVQSADTQPVFASLTSIILTYNLLPVLNLTLFVDMKALIELHVNNNRLEHIEIKPGQVPSLKCLKVCGNALHTLNLIDLPELIEIHASGNQIRSEQDVHLANSNATICIADNPIELDMFSIFKLFFTSEMCSSRAK
uniref:Uncharacterized protein n=1 Tax=Anopheles albimanus TaxID=7167 RepID=A0A182FVP2_ANOAL